MRIDDDRGLSSLLDGPEERLCSGFGFTEGPIWVPGDAALLFSDIPNNCIYRWREGWADAEMWRAPSGWSNGLTIDGDGCVVACEHGGRRVSRGAYNTPSSTVSLASEWQGLPLNSPNDLVVHSSGAVFFTDPAYGCNPHRTPLLGAVGQRQVLPFQGVYRIDPDATLHVVDEAGFAQPNGLAFSPDERCLYVGDSHDRVIWRFRVNADLALTERVLFVDQRADPRLGNPDGMKVDTEGRLWTTGAGGVSVHTARGECLGVFALDEHAANLAFGGDGWSMLYITARTGVYRVRTRVRGLAPGSR